MVSGRKEEDAEENGEGSPDLLVLFLIASFGEVGEGEGMVPCF
jgi:hypothetical protein